MTKTYLLRLNSSLVLTVNITILYVSNVHYTYERSSFVVLPSVLGSETPVKIMRKDGWVNNSHVQMYNRNRGI